MSGETREEKIERLRRAIEEDPEEFFRERLPIAARRILRQLRTERVLGIVREVEDS